MKHAVLVVVALLIAASVLADPIATLRGGEIDVEAEPKRMPTVVNDDIRLKRNYPMQPPTIPHIIDKYQVDLNANSCMRCHSRKLSQNTGAPMVSVTHYMDRDGNFLASISPRRYFCSQCHVVQLSTPELVANEFVDMDEMIEPQAGAER